MKNGVRIIFEAVKNKSDPIFIFAVILWSASPFVFSETNQKTKENIKIERQWQGYYSGFTSPSRMVITTAQDWKEAWQKIHSLKLPVPKTPKIDFAKQMVLAVFMGEKRSGGYEIKISKISKTEGGIFVEVAEKEPSPESLRTMALTSPYHIVVIKKFSLPVIFQSP